MYPTDSNSEYELAKAHIDAVYQLIAELLEVCGDRYTADLDTRIRDLLDSFQRYRSGTGNPNLTEPTAYDNALSHNFITAQCCILLAFCHRVSQLASEEAGPLADRLRAALADARSDWTACYRRMFGVELN